MANMVSAGYAAASALAIGFRSSGTRISVHHNAQPMCRLGMAAYWFETFSHPADSNDHNPPTSMTVSM